MTAYEGMTPPPSGTWRSSAGGSGKTQLASAILFDAGMVNRLGRVDDGTTVTDFDDEKSPAAHPPHRSPTPNGTSLNQPDRHARHCQRLSDTQAALRVADAALLVVDAVAGVEVQTEKTWEAADELELPRLVVLNRCDRERASLDRSLESLRAVFGRTVIPIQVPLGEEKAFKGVVDLVSMMAFTFEADGSGKMTEG
jgi:elongation factor G